MAFRVIASFVVFGVPCFYPHCIFPLFLHIGWTNIAAVRYEMLAVIAREVDGDRQKRVAARIVHTYVGIS
jgi:hypothetical protein